MKFGKLSKKKKKNEFAEYRDVLELFCYYFRIELQLSTIGYFNTGSQSILRCHVVLPDSVYYELRFERHAYYKNTIEQKVSW